MRQACPWHPLGSVLKAARCQLPCNPTSAASFDGWGTAPSLSTVPLEGAERGKERKRSPRSYFTSSPEDSRGRFLGLSAEIIISKPQIRAQDLTEEVF